MARNNRVRRAPGCTKCGSTDADNFHPSMPYKCRPCLAEWQRGYRASQKGKPGWKRTQRRYAMRKRYGIELEEYQALYEAQGGKCAICRVPVDDLGGPKKHRLLHIDHDHATGVVRGLLCNPCNRALGFLRDDPEIALAAAEYLVAPRVQKAEYVDLIRDACGTASYDYDDPLGNLVTVCWMPNGHAGPHAFEQGEQPP